MAVAHRGRGARRAASLTGCGGAMQPEELSRSVQSRALGWAYFALNGGS